MMALMATPAEAQTPHLTVGVIDFRNESGVQGEVLSRLATDAVALELAKQPTFDILSRAQVTQQMKQLGLTPPLNKIGVSKLGEALTADAMVEGSIRSAQVRGQGASRRAAVTIIVRMLDQASGEVINGGIQTGYSNPRVGYDCDDDTLITEAIDNAAFLVVKTMAEYIIPEATVMNSVGSDQVMLNKGSRDGIKRGMRLILKRDKEIIGYLQAANVTPTDSIATVIRAMRGVKAEDRATAIFDMPAVSEVHADPTSTSMGAPPAKKSGTKLGGAKTALLALGAIIGIAALVKGGSGSESAGSATLRQTLNGVEIKWNQNHLWGGKNVMEAHVWRSDERTPIAAEPWGAGRALDDTITEGVVKDVTYDAPAADKTLDEDLASEVDPLVPNRTYTYRFSAIYKITTTQGDKTVDQYYETEMTDAGRITFIDPWEPTGDNLEEPAEGSEFNPANT
jgi:TolB-like protein